MNNEQIRAFIVRRWRDDHDPTAIMMQLICLGAPVLKSDVLKTIRRYVDESDEAVVLGAKKERP